MKTEGMPKELAISTAEACTLAVECWRLTRTAELLKHSNDAPGLRQAARRLAEVLDRIGIQVVDFIGRKYDPGLAPEVVDILEDQTLLGDVAVIDETITPTVMWRGQVVQPGQIVVRCAPKIPSIAKKPSDD